ncbi:MAG TPA: cobalamin-independent methionine synthase II family protein [Candidatus Tectomicrobia bacterium]|jgi:5-methyltetrahydropteroyltriglutamate--homocysteine methyltransferase
MKRSTERILTTHTGSLARSPELLQLLLAREEGQPVDPGVFDNMVRRAVTEKVRRQVEVGLAIVNDGEQSKISFATYVRERLHGFGGADEPRPVSLEAREFPEYAARRAFPYRRPACNAPVAWKDFSAVEKDIAHLKAATAGLAVEEVFMTAVSPGTLANFFPNRYYPTREAYLEAMSEVMKREYEAIVQAGFLLQLDCPDLALRSTWFPDLSVPEFRTVVAQNVEALNHATRDIPAEHVRLHVCWGAGEGPRNHDVPLRDIVDVLLKARPAAMSIMGANGRHEHEWKVWKDMQLPAGKVLIPGVIDSTTNIIEHPEVVADRLVRYANMLGRENIIAGVDCGFGTNARTEQVDPRIAWAKLQALVEGAELATRELWGK